MKAYNNFEEWKKDMDIFKDNPRDTRFLMHISDRVKKSDETLQAKIQDVLEEEAFKKDPLDYMIFLANKSEGKVPVIKSKQDIWFEV